jgi:hypothetical protein
MGSSRWAMGCLLVMCWQGTCGPVIASCRKDSHKPGISGDDGDLRCHNPSTKPDAQHRRARPHSRWLSL